MHKSLIGAAVAASLTMGALGSANAQMVIPTDSIENCAVTESELKGWFAGDRIEANGWVAPPDGSTFDDSTTCDFYKWGQQMFMWLTSAIPKDGYVLDSPEIFTVQPAADGMRTMVQNSGDSASMVSVRSAKTGDDIGELAQAGSDGVLVSQQGSLVYYGISVNNLMAYFATGIRNDAPTLTAMTDFPFSQSNAETVKKYADANISKQDTSDFDKTLSMEMKTSWVDASTLVEGTEADYVIIDAVVPNYIANGNNTVMSLDKTNPTAQKKLALVGIHVVGTVKGHPEFVWATFEHINNAPNNDYYYLQKATSGTAGTLTKQPFSAAGTYLFANGAAQPATANVACAVQVSGSQAGKSPYTGLNAGDLVAISPMSAANPFSADPVTAGGPLACPEGIAPSNTVRMHPWGGLPNTATAENNSMLISLYTSVAKYLKTSDVRNNYVQIGGIWTNRPTGATAAPIPNQADFTMADLRGSLNLYNSTMETYTWEASPNCFSCHSLSPGDNSFVAFGLSHIFSELQALPTK